MVNPLKHANNLNEKDLECIYNNLCKEYNLARDFNTKKNLNQQILILILLSRRFPIKDIVNVSYDFFKREPHNTLLYKHLLEHSLNNYCTINGLLLTNNHNQALSVEEIEKLLLNIDKGDVKKELSIENIGITNSILNDFGKKIFDKKKIKAYLNNNSKSIEVKEDIQKQESKVRDEDLKLTDKLIDEISDRIINHLNDKILEYDLTGEIQEVKEKQEILENSIFNKHNQLYNKMNKVHQKIKVSNKKYEEFNIYFNEIALIKDSINTSLTKHNEKLAELEEKFDEVLDKMDEDSKNYKYISKTCLDNDECMIRENGGKDRMQVTTESISYFDIKEFVYNWFNHNLKISNNIHNAITMDEINSKINRALDEQNIKMNKDILFNRMESYLSGWYTQHNPKISFKDIKNVSIKENVFYSNLKFININEERENRIKNIVVQWLKENTCEVEGSKTYTQEIFDKIEPIFAENGWIITTPEEWKELHNAGFSKVVPARTFSQIIGKAVQEVYNSISKDTIQRDTPSETGNVTWYPNIEILDKQVSNNLQSAIQDELSNDIFESDNLIYTWLKENLIYTSSKDDTIETSTLFEKIIKHLQVHEIKISQKSLVTIFNSILSIYLTENNIELNNTTEIVGFKLLDESVDKASNIIKDWISNHIIITDNCDEKVLIEDIREKVLSALYHEDISLINSNVFAQLPVGLKSNFIIESEFDEQIENALIEKVGPNKISKDIEGSYIEQIQIIKYKPLKEEHLRTWINNNLEELLKANVANRKNIINIFKRYIEEHNIKNTTQHSIGELVDTAMREYYSNINEVTLKILNDSQNEYYVLVTD